MKILITADWHIRGDRPRCRTDEDWLESQREDIRAVVKVARQKRVDAVWILGDLFHQPRCATEAVNMVLAELNRLRDVCPVRILPGNHDLPYHDFNNLHACSLGIVYNAGYDMLKTDSGDEDEGFGELALHPGFRTLYATPFGMEDTEGLREFVNDFWATHQLTFETEKDRPIEGIGKTAQDLLDMAPGVSVIMTGDYHHGYVYRNADRCVITPGCLNIQVADMANYRPRVYILETTSLEVEAVYLEGHAGDIVTDYLETERERDERMEKVLSVIGGADGVSLSFTDNLEREIARPEFATAREVYPELKDKLNKDRV